MPLTLRRERRGISTTVIVVAVVVIIALAGFGAYYFYQGQSSSQASGNLTIYSTFADALNKALIGNFTQLYPNIHVSVVQGASDGLASRALTEYQSGKVQADVIQIEYSELLILKSNGALQSYNSQQRSNYPSNFVVDSSGYVQPTIRIAPYVLLYNTQLTPSNAVPHNLTDVLNPAFKGKIALVDPTLHTPTLEFFAGLNGTVFKTPAAYQAFISGLVAQQPSLSNTLLTSAPAAASGQDLIGAGFLGYVVSLKPAPLDWVRYSPLLAISYNPAILTNAPDLANAKLWIDFVLGQKGAQIMSSFGEIPGYTGITPNIPGVGTALSTIKILTGLSSSQTTYWKNYFKAQGL